MRITFDRKEVQRGLFRKDKICLSIIVEFSEVERAVIKRNKVGLWELAKFDNQLSYVNHNNYAILRHQYSSFFRVCDIENGQPVEFYFDTATQATNVERNITLGLQKFKRYLDENAEPQTRKSVIDL